MQTATLSFSEPTDATYAGTHTETLTFGISVEDATVTVTGVSLDKNTLELTAGGDTATLTATVLPENATDKTVTWSSDNEAVATVVDGVVTPIAKGTATITATAGGKSDTCTVTVKQLYSITFTGPYTGETLVMEFYEGDTWNDMAAKYPNTIKIYSGYAAFGSDGFIYESPYGSMVSATAQIDPNKTYEVE
ncbi:MAG: Ig domain-containing protein [Ruminococcus sp.]|nr:Ig domain-containing protein [Ruminococcus sp.]